LPSRRPPSVLPSFLPRACKYARVSQGCHKGVTRVSQGCHKGVTRVSQGCHKGVTRVSQGCHKGVTRAVVQGEHAGQEGKGQKGKGGGGTLGEPLSGRKYLNSSSKSGWLLNSF
jgi:hypothetical protein